MEFLEANKNGTAESFITSHPSVSDFLARKPGFPQSFATEQFFGVNAFKFINADGKKTYFRYKIVPEAGVMPLTQDVVEKKGADYLFKELETHLAKSTITCYLHWDGHPQVQAHECLSAHCEISAFKISYRQRSQFLKHKVPDPSYARLQNTCRISGFVAVNIPWDSHPAPGSLYPKSNFRL